MSENTVISERIKKLHKKLEENKYAILKDRTNKMSIKLLSEKYDVNNNTLSDWLFYWEYGFKRRKSCKIRTNSKMAKINKKEFSQGLKNQMRINTVFNDKLIRYAKDD